MDYQLTSGIGLKDLSHNKWMAGYSSTPLWKKLGYKADVEVYLDNAPRGYVALLDLPAGLSAQWLDKPKRNVPFVHLFTDKAATLKRKLCKLRKLVAADGVIWVSWPKKSSGVVTDITEDVIRAIALPLGLVDIKVCAIDDVWSGLKLMIRKTER